jgi:hypothetical protein
MRRPHLPTAQTDADPSIDGFGGTAVRECTAAGGAQSLGLAAPAALSAQVSDATFRSKRLTARRVWSVAQCRALARPSAGIANHSKATS